VLPRTARALSGRTRERASWAETITLSATRPSPTPARTSQARNTPWFSCAWGTNVRITAVPCGKPATATSTSVPPAIWLVPLLPPAASRTLRDRCAAAPSVGPSGMKIVMGCVGSCAFARRKATLRSGMPSVSTRPAMNWASTVAALTARSAWKVRSSSASGTRNETRIIELIATASRMMRSLMGASWGCGELHADPAHGVQVPRLLRALAELPAQP
jgi:hypothetical protein